MVMRENKPCQKRTPHFEMSVSPLFCGFHGIQSPIILIVFLQLISHVLSHALRFLSIKILRPVLTPPHLDLLKGTLKNPIEP